MDDGLKATGAVALVASGIASAFALASCCAFPVLIGSAAIGLAPIASATEPHGTLLTAIFDVGLVGSAAVAARAPKQCETGSICSRGWFRWSIIGAAAIGSLLLVLSKVYA